VIKTQDSRLYRCTERRVGAPCRFEFPVDG